LDDEHPKYYFKNIKKIINLIFKIRYCYAYVLYNMNDSGIETDKSETVTQLKERIVNEYDETEEGNQLGSIFCNLTDTYEIARYAERLPDPANYENIENDVKNTVRLCKSILRNKGKKLKK